MCGTEIEREGSFSGSTQVLEKERGRMRAAESHAADLAERHQTGGRLVAAHGAQPRRHLRQPGSAARR